MWPIVISVRALLENAKVARGMLLSPTKRSVNVTIATSGMARRRLSRFGLRTSLESPFLSA